MATKPTFIDVNAQQIVAEMKTYYETATGKKLQPAQVEMLLINMFAYREALIRSAIQEAACQNLVEFATAPTLDFLANLVGLSRTPELPADCTIRFALVAGHTGVSIPIGMRVQSADGKVVFQTIETKTATTEETHIDVKANCQTLGVIGNGYASNQINNILDPLSYVSSAGNLAITQGGADTETDEHLRDRVKAVPGRFSNAGPRDAYLYFSKNAHPAITDVTVLSESGGHVDIYVLTEDEETSSEVISAVNAACNAETVRPLTDIVSVHQPAAVHYIVEINLTILPTAVGSVVIQQVQAALDAYVLLHRNKLGKDIVRTALIALSMVEGVYDADVTLAQVEDPDPVSVDVIVLDTTTRAILDTSEVQVVGTSDE